MLLRECLKSTRPVGLLRAAPRRARTGLDYEFLSDPKRLLDDALIAHLLHVLRQKLLLVAQVLLHRIVIIAAVLLVKVEQVDDLSR